MNRSRLARLAVAATSAVLVLLAASPASANHGDSGAPVLTRDPDNTDQEYEMISMTTGGFGACDWGADELERTQITTSLGDGDIHCRDALFGETWLGLTTCTDVNLVNRRCNHYDVDFDTESIDTTPDTAAEWNEWFYIGCHEFGHTGGLGHETASSNYSSCMENGSGHTRFRQHDIDEINEDV